MSSFVPNKVFLRGVLLHYFKMRKSAAESHRILQEVYGEHALAEQTCRKWFARFKSGDFALEDKERPGQTKKFEDADLEALLDENSCRTHKELAESLGVDRSTIAKRLHNMGMIQKQGNWVQYQPHHCVETVMLEGVAISQSIPKSTSGNLKNVVQNLENELEKPIRKRRKEPSVEKDSESLKTEEKEQLSTKKNERNSKKNVDAEKVVVTKDSLENNIEISKKAEDTTANEEVLPKKRSRKAQ